MPSTGIVFFLLLNLQIHTHTRYVCKYNNPIYPLGIYWKGGWGCEMKNPYKFRMNFHTKREFIMTFSAMLLFFYCCYSLWTAAAKIWDFICVPGGVSCFCIFFYMPCHPIWWCQETPNIRQLQQQTKTATFIQKI